MKLNLGPEKTSLKSSKRDSKRLVRRCLFGVV
jgi:hypothetical protein